MIYTYLIGWSAHDRWYYGVRFSRRSREGDLWKTYFTSSNNVKAFRNTHGEPDIIQIRKTFATKEKAIEWETKVLTRLDVIHSVRWLNKTNNRAIRDGSPTKGPRKAWNKGLSIPRTQESIEKQKVTITGAKRGPYKNFNFERAKARPVKFRGTEYPSISQARESTGASFYTIKRYDALANSIAVS